jgi:hypothetical protein
MPDRHGLTAEKNRDGRPMTVRHRAATSVDVLDEDRATSSSGRAIPTRLATNPTRRRDLMRWRTSLLTVPIVAAGLVTGAAPVAADCATDGLTWPERGAAEGITFTGEAIRKVKTAGGFSGYRFDVDHVYAGELGGRVDVAIVCVESTFEPGERYLVSSAGWTGSASDLDVGTLEFSDQTAVAWQVDGGGTVALVDFGAGTGEAPAYLAAPQTLKQAVSAVTLGNLPPTDLATGPSLFGLLTAIRDWALGLPSR